MVTLLLLAALTLLASASVSAPTSSSSAASDASCGTCLLLTYCLRIITLWTNNTTTILLVYHVLGKHIALMATSPNICEDEMHQNDQEPKPDTIEVGVPTAAPLDNEEDPDMHPSTMEKYSCDFTPSLVAHELIPDVDADTDTLELTSCSANANLLSRVHHPLM
ncbi:hypothetical protein B0H10DRAFT_1947389 [Mycena sp. CBHHK59/15]|nr:hypothetical protein B0H10DRAFT_1947389 [Mycena sp. CBHHK59/15]